MATFVRVSMHGKRALREHPMKAIVLGHKLCSATQNTGQARKLLHLVRDTEGAVSRSASVESLLYLSKR